MRPQSGVALITAMLVVAIAALAATALLGSANLSIHRTGVLRDTEQAWWTARGVQSWVLGILDQDARDSTYDGLDEAWSQPVDYLPLDQGFVRGNIIDAQGAFNLNNLAVQSNAVVYQQQFERLISGLPAVQEMPANLVNAIRDWMDADSTPGFPGGAEDTEYLSRNPPYRAANRPFTVVSELLAVQGMTRELYQALTRCEIVNGRPRSCITVLPGAAAQAPAAGVQATPVNVNTAPEPVLRALSGSVNESALRQFLAERVEKPDQTVADFLRRNIFGADVTADRIAVSSHYFQIQGEVFVGSSRVSLYSLIQRPGQGPPVVLAHSADAD